MFNNKTVLVIGAGASKEVNVPTGAELKGQIARSLNIKFKNGWDLSSGEPRVVEAIREAIRVPDGPRKDINDYCHAGRIIAEAMPHAMSIDNFLEAHSDNERIVLCGKLAIVNAVLAAERGSKLFVDRSRGNDRLAATQVEGTWYTRFLRLLTEGCRLEKLPERLSSITLIIFNYDRCVEQYLYYALQTYYAIGTGEAANLVKMLKVFHPYGQVGNLPWLQPQGAIEFGQEPGVRQLVDLASQIKTFAEGTDPAHSDVGAIRQSVAEAKILVFLGFAYHRQNLALIRPEDRSAIKERARIYGTAKGISTPDTELVISDLDEMRPIDPGHAHIRNNLLCASLFDEYWRSLSLS